MSAREWTCVGCGAPVDDDGDSRCNCTGLIWVKPDRKSLMLSPGSWRDQAKASRERAKRLDLMAAEALEKIKA
jgi:hypothetical protein